MRPYETIIIESLKGDTPKAKYENLLKMQKMLHQIAYPARGTEEESLSIEVVAQMIIESNLIDQHETYDE